DEAAGRFVVTPLEGHDRLAYVDFRKAGQLARRGGGVEEGKDERKHSGLDRAERAGQPLSARELVKRVAWVHRHFGTKYEKPLRSLTNCGRTTKRCMLSWQGCPQRTKRCVIVSPTWNRSW